MLITQGSSYLHYLPCRKKIGLCFVFSQHKCELLLIDASQNPALFSLDLWNCGLGSFLFLRILWQKSFCNTNQTSKVKFIKVLSNK